MPPSLLILGHRRSCYRSGMNAPAQRQLRADAARNAERIMREAREAFAELGADVSLEEIARRAGVGVATLYRRFVNKEELIGAIVRWRYDERVQPVVDRALADEDPWRGMVSLLEAAVGMAAEERPVLLAAGDLREVTAPYASRYFPALAAIAGRARERGQVRADLADADLPRLLYMLVATLRLPDGQDAWRRYLGLLLDALRPTAATPLPPAPPDGGGLPFGCGPDDPPVRGADRP
jgi:AcrR family transcriptional regulator